MTVKRQGAGIEPSAPIVFQEERPEKGEQPVLSSAGVRKGGSWVQGS